MSPMLRRSPKNRDVPACTRRGRRGGQEGFSLIELMISMVIALVIVVGVLELFVASASSERTNSTAAEIATSGRYAIGVLRRDLQHAGFRGVTYAQPGVLTTTIPAVTGECGAGFAINISQRVWGNNDSNPFSATCIPTANYLAGDILVIRRTGVSVITSLNANSLYVRSSYERGEVFRGNTPPPLFTQVPNFDYALETVVYYISPYTNAPTESPRVPALYRLEMGAGSGGPTMTPALVASNIEDMQVQYGRTLTDLTTQYYNANNISATVTPSEWDDVKSVRIWILVRATMPEQGYTNTATYTLGDRTITVNDGFRREVFSAVIQMRNL